MISSVYIHIPFCEHICNYCDFCKLYYNENLVNKYLNSLEKEIKKAYKGELIKTIYIGGGTPSSLNFLQLKRLFSIIKIFNIDKDYEFTIEVNPENIDFEKLTLMEENGVNRISMGIESTNNEILKILNRQYTYDLVIEKIKLIKKAGFLNINVDLMYAIMNEDIKQLEIDIDNILKLDIKHISTYSLMIEPNTVFSVKNVKPVSEELDSDMYKTIINKLSNNGFNHYEISNFAKSGYESQHNLVYWHNENYYGFGLGASGYINNTRYDNTRSMVNYLKNDYLLNNEILNENEKISYELILGFRLIKGINKIKFKEKYHKELCDMYNINDLIKKKDLIDDGNNIYVSYDKIYIENNILINFVGEV